MLSPFLLSAAQRRLITAEAPNPPPLPLPLPLPFTGLKTLCPDFALLPWRYVYGKLDTMAVSGTGHPTAADSPSSKEVKGDCAAGNAPGQQPCESGRYYKHTELTAMSAAAPLNCWQQPRGSMK